MQHMCGNDCLCNLHTPSALKDKLPAAPPRKLVYRSGPPLWVSRHRLNTYTMAGFDDFCQKLGQRLMATILIKFLNFRLLKLKRLRSKHHQHEKFLKLKENCIFYGISSLFFWRMIPNSDQCLCSGVETTFKNNFIYKKILY